MSYVSEVQRAKLRSVYRFPLDLLGGCLVGAAPIVLAGLLVYCFDGFMPPRPAHYNEPTTNIDTCEGPSETFASVAHEDEPGETVIDGVLTIHRENEDLSCDVVIDPLDEGLVHHCEYKDDAR